MLLQKHAVLAGTNSNLHESVFVEHPGKTQKRWQSIIALFSFHKGPPNFRRRRPPYKLNASWKARQSVRPAGNLARNFVNTSHSGRHILESRCADRCANDAFLTSFRATLTCKTHLGGSCLLYSGVWFFFFLKNIPLLNHSSIFCTYRTSVINSTVEVWWALTKKKCNQTWKGAVWQGRVFWLQPYRVGLQAQANFSAPTFEPAHEAHAEPHALLFRFS